MVLNQWKAYDFWDQNFPWSSAFISNQGLMRFFRRHFFKCCSHLNMVWKSHHRKFQGHIGCHPKRQGKFFLFPLLHLRIGPFDCKWTQRCFLRQTSYQTSFLEWVQLGHIFLLRYRFVETGLAITGWVSISFFFVA